MVYIADTDAHSPCAVDSSALCHCGGPPFDLSGLSKEDASGKLKAFRRVSYNLFGTRGLFTAALKAALNKSRLTKKEMTISMMASVDAMQAMQQLEDIKLLAGLVTMSLLVRVSSPKKS